MDKSQLTTQYMHFKENVKNNKKLLTPFKLTLVLTPAFFTHRAFIIAILSAQNNFPMLLI